MSKKSEILKLLQESAKLDRAGIRIGWCDDVKKDQPILRMEFSKDELEWLLNRVGDNEFLRKRLEECYDMYMKCLMELEP